MHSRSRAMTSLGVVLGIQLGLLLSAGAAPARAAPTVQDPARWFSAPLPDGWTVSADATTVRIASGKNWVTFIDGPLATPEEATRALDEQMRAGYRSFEKTGSGRPQVAGQAAVYATFRAIKESGETFAIMTAGIQAPNGHVVLYVSSAPSGQIDAVSPEFSRILNGIAFHSADPAPSRPAAAAPATPAKFDSFDSPGGGHILAGIVPGAAGAPATALGALLRRLQETLGARPVVSTRANDGAHGASVLFFSVPGAGKGSTGMAIVSAAPGAPATAAAVYDQADRFASSVGPMLKELQQLTDASAPRARGAPLRMAPAAPLTLQNFADGTGSIGVPAGWKLNAAGGGSANVVGPHGEIVAWNLATSLQDPTNSRGVYGLRTLPAQFQKTTALLAYERDPARVWTAVWPQIARQDGKAPPELTVDSAVPASGPANSVQAQLVGSWRMPASAEHPAGLDGSYLALVQLLPANNMGQWTMASTFLFVPKAVFAQTGATAQAILQSVKINFGAVAAQADATRKMFRDRFDQMIANARAQDEARSEGTRRALAVDRAAQENMHRRAVDFEHYVLDEAVVANLRDGTHALLGSAYADALVRGNPDFVKVPASELLRGVDY